MAFPKTLVLFLLALPVLYAQPDGFRFANYTVENGLSSSWIFDIAQDSTGYIWLAGQSGLSRFDGVHFKNYYKDAGDTSGAVSNWVTHLAPAPEGGLWCTTVDEYLNYFDPETEDFVQYLKPPSSTSKTKWEFIYAPWPQALWVAQDGKVWTANWEQLQVFDPATGTFQSFPYYQGENAIRCPLIRVIQGDVKQEEKLWIGTSTGLYSFNKKRSVFTHVNSSFTPNILSIEQTVDGVLWVGTYQNGLWQFDPFRKEWEAIHLDFSGSIPEEAKGREHAIFWIESVGDHLYLGTMIGLVIYNPNTGMGQLLKNDHSDPASLLPGQVERIFQDKQNRTWLATFSGVSLLDPRRNVLQSENIGLKFWTKKDAVYDPEERAFYLIEEDRINQLIRFSLETRQQQVIQLKGMEDYESSFTDICRKSDGTILLSTKHRLFQYAPAKESVSEVDMTLPDTQELQIRKVMEDSLGNIVLMGEKSIAISQGPGRSAIRITFPETNAVIQSMALSASGVLAGVGNNLFLLRYPDYEVIRFLLHPNPDHGDNNIGSMWEAPSGDLWLSALKKKLFRTRLTADSLQILQTYSRKNGLAADFVYEVTGDDRGYLWLFTNRGLASLRLKDGHITMYGKKYGVEEMELYNKWISTTRSGYMLFYNAGNLTWFHPEDFSEANPRDNPLVLGETTVLNTPRDFGKNINYLDAISLSHRQNVFSISFRALNYTDPEQHQYAYQLEGFDEDWQYVGSRNTAYYTNLPPGDYRFRVKTAGSDGYWYERDKALTVSIIPAFWQTAWFRLLIGLAVTGILYILYRYRTRQIRREEALRFQHVHELADMELKALRSQMNPHFMFNALNSIKQFILNQNALEAADYLSRFAHLIRTTLNLSQEKRITLEKELDTLANFIELEQLRFGDKIRFLKEVDEHIDTRSVYVPPLLFQPFVENAIWHGLLHKDGGGTIAIRIEEEGQYIRCSIVDDGVGRARAAELKSRSATRHKSLGMQLTQKRIDLHNRLDHLGIRLEVIDKKDEEGQALGTEVVIRIPLNSEVSPNRME